MMKLILNYLALLMLFLHISCKKADTNSVATTTTTGNFNIATATLLKQGTFSGNMNYEVTGTVKLYNDQGKFFIYFENFSSSNGPDLKVYVATNNNANQFISLGTLKANTGSYYYEILNAPNFDQYNKILIWCQQFSVLFGNATLQ
jgi:Electron transfer DM13